MINKLLAHLKFYFYPPKTGSIYYGDPTEFVCGKPIELALHNITLISGDPVWQVMPSPGAYRLTIESDNLSYYECKAEVLCRNIHGTGMKWLERSQPRRIPKQNFKEMVIVGKLKRDWIR
jgi:hypothetical protein